MKISEELFCGGKVEKKILFRWKMSKKRKNDKDIKRTKEKSNRSDVLKEERWFSARNKTMKSHLDDKMYRLYGHCFDCQVSSRKNLKRHFKIGRDKRY